MNRFTRFIKHLVEMHKRFIFWYKSKLGLSDYALLWVVFLKGFLAAIILDSLIAE